MWRIFKEKLNQHKDADRLIAEVARFMMIWAWLVTKWRGVMCCFLHNKKEEEKEKEKKWGVGLWGRLSGSYLNITNEFTNWYYQ